MGRGGVLFFARKFSAGGTGRCSHFFNMEYQKFINSIVSGISIVILVLRKLLSRAPIDTIVLGTEKKTWVAWDFLPDELARSQHIHSGWETSTHLSLLQRPYILNGENSNLVSRVRRRRAYDVDDRCVCSSRIWLCHTRSNWSLPLLNSHLSSRITYVIIYNSQQPFLCNEGFRVSILPYGRSVLLPNMQKKATVGLKNWSSLLYLKAFDRTGWAHASDSTHTKIVTILPCNGGE